MKKEKIDKNDFEEESRKKLDEIIKQSKAENAALKKLLIGLEKLEEKLEEPVDRKKRTKKK